MNAGRATARGLVSSILAAGCAAALAVTSAYAAEPPGGACKLTQIGELPVKFEHNQPLIQAEVNGRKVWFVADTGASKTLLFADAASRLGLRPKDADGVEFYGVGGVTRGQMVTLKELKLGKYSLDRPTLFVVGGSVRSEGDVVGVIGRDLFSRVEIELDLKAGVIRLIRAESCRNADLAYWSRDFAIAMLRRPGQGDGPFQVDVLLNGRRVSAEIDSGAVVSTVTAEAARYAGVRPKRAVANGSAVGFGPNAVATYTATFAKLEIGDESDGNVQLQIADLFRGTETQKLGSHIGLQSDDTPGMLLGADFLRAHRVLLSNSQNRMYFTYHGGRIFQVVSSDATAAPTGTSKAP